MTRYHWIKSLIEDPDHPGELLVDMSDACEVLGWQPGDRLEWIDNRDGSWTVRRVEDAESDQ